jgi:DNA-binding response OmpR family regulator
MIFGSHNKDRSSSARGQPLIHIIEDDQDLCHVLRMVLEHEDYAVRCAHDGVEGLEMIRARPPRIVVLDIKLPRLNGYQVLAEIQKDSRLAAIPVIIITSLSSEENHTDDEWAARLGVRRFLSKPFDPAVLVEAVNEALACPPEPQRRLAPPAEGD